MAYNPPTVKLSYDKSSTNLLSVKIRVSFNREQRRYAFPIAGGVLVSPADFDRLVKYDETRSARTAEEIKQLHALLLPHLEKAENVAAGLSPFRFADFKTRFYSADTALPQTPGDLGLLSDLDALEKAHELNGQISYAEEFGNARKSLARFLSYHLPGQTTLAYEAMTVDFLLRYEQWMLMSGKQHRGKLAHMKAVEGTSITTVGIYLRAVRKAYLKAIDTKKVNADLYPFGKGRYVIPTGRNIKKALSKSDVQKLIQVEVLPGMPQRSRDLWVFSYLTNGMNLTDICHLQWKHLDLNSGKLEFVREKTARTGRGEQVKISATLFEESLAIIQRQKNQDPNSPFVFPFFKPGLSAQQEKNVVKQLVKDTNKHMRLVAIDAGVTADVTTYTARHSFATILLRSEVPLAFISQKLGHKTIQTTENYLGSFEDAQEKDYLNRLV